MGIAIGPNGPTGVTPRPVKELAWDNYLNIDDLKFDQQFLPEVYEKEIERFGNRTISGFLRMVGAEMPMASDVVTWVEQGRLHIAYTDVSTNTGADDTIITMSSADHLVSAGNTVLLASADGLTTQKLYVTSLDPANNAILNVVAYGSSAAGAVTIDSAAAANLKLFVYGSEYGKGSKDVGASIEANSSFFSNKPIILRDKYSVYGSNVAQIGWIEVTTEAGTGGYLWYLKSEHESRLRFQDYLEMSMVEAEKSTLVNGTDRPITPAGIGTNANAQITGTEGLFAAIEDRGNVFTGLDLGNGTYVTAGGPADGANSVYYAQNNGLAEFDTILQQLDTQGAIEENMLFLDRATALGFDNMLAGLNAPYGGGTSYGVFENSEDMALNLGFNGFRRGSYDFYKTDWKYLNDSTTRGLVGDIEGVLIPAGVSTVYDQQLGSNIQRPFLHVRYRASEADDRRMKSWITGSVGGNYTSDEDAMNVHFLSERALCVQGANNFVIFKAS
jgi:hypothetical protein